jgi:hypothetical protein
MCVAVGKRSSSSEDNGVPSWAEGEEKREVEEVEAEGRVE